MVKKKRRTGIIIIALILVCLLYLHASSTYTSYESEVEGSADSEVADWKIKVNDTLITADQTTTINIDSIDWETEHTREGTISPGTSGTITITVNPTTTQVAFDYELIIIDKTVDETKLLTVTSVENTLTPLTKEDNIYRGIMTLENIKNKATDTIKIHAIWDDNGEDVEVDPDEETEKSDLIEIDFKAKQRT